MSAVLTPADRQLADQFAGLDCTLSHGHGPAPSIVTGQYSTIVSPWDFEIEVNFDFDDGEPAIYWPIEHAHPGVAPEAYLVDAKVGGISIYQMLSPEQIERIENDILRQEEA